MAGQLTLFGKSALVPTSVQKLFDEFWLVFPKRTGSDPRKPAQEKFCRLVQRDHVDPMAIIEGARRYAASNPDPNYTCQATTFLNQARWEQREYRPPVQEPTSMLDISLR